MARSDYGLDPGYAARRARERYRELADESGLRPLPSEAAPLDLQDEEPIDIPGTSYSRATLFGIGAGVGVAAFAIVVGLYAAGLVGNPILSAPQTTTSVRPDLRPLEQAQDARALELARIATADRWAPSASIPATQFESPDIQVIDHTGAPKAPEATAPPATESSDRAGALSNELERLKRRVPMPVTTAPEMPTDETAPPRESVPEPAQPTAPAETAEPTNP
jgi:hypothetical protein